MRLPTRPMKRRATTRVAGAALLVVVLAAALVVIAFTSAGPTVVVPDTIEFGEVLNEQHVPIEILVRNSGRGTLRIERVDTSCSCVSSEIQDKVVSPGGVGTVRVVYRAGGFPGSRISQVVVIHTNDPRQPRVSVVLSGRMNPTLSVSPAVLRVIVPPESTSWRRDLILSTTAVGEPFEITRVSSTLPGFCFTIKTLDVASDSIAVDGSGAGWRVTVGQDTMPPEPGTYAGRIDIATTSKRLQSCSVPATVVVEPTIRTTPRMLLFHRDHGGDRSDTQEVSLRAMHPVTLRVQGESGMEYTLDDDAGEARTAWSVKCAVVDPVTVRGAIRLVATGGTGEETVIEVPFFVSAPPP